MPASGVTPLPGAIGIEAARERLQAHAGLSEAGRERLLDIYGGRATEILDLAESDPDHARVIDANRSVLAAEVVFCIRSEFARRLTDLMHRRLMIGLSADQGEEVIEAVAAIAGAEFGWDEEQRQEQFNSLRRYNARLNPNQT